MPETLMLPEFLRFKERLNSSDMDERCKVDSPKRVAQLIQQYESQPENRTEYRVRKAVRKEVRRTLAHLTTAARNVGDRRLSRRVARELIRGSTTFANFKELAVRASSYRGRHNSLVRGHNDRTLRDQARTLTIDQDHKVHEIKTRSQLQSIGKKLRNCLGYDSSNLASYAAELRTGEWEFWELKRGDETIGLMSIDRADKEIDEFYGYDNEPTGCKRSTLLKLIEKLNVTGDDVDELIDNGVFEYFLHHEEGQYQEVKVGGIDFKVWGRPGEVILHSEPNRWALLSFKPRYRRLGVADSRQFGEFELSGNLVDSVLVEMLLDSAELRNLVNQYRTESSRLSDRLKEEDDRW